MLLSSWLYSIKRPFHFIKTGVLNGVSVQFKYHQPQKKIKVIAITGTDGKTTSSTLLYHTLKNAGYKVALLSTVAAYIGDKTIDTGLHVTSPSPADLYKFMNQMVQENIEYLVLETTSQGIYQYRTWGVKPILVGVTNVAPEHLDYHLTLENYLQAKLLLLRTAPAVVLNADDSSYGPLKRGLKSGQKVIEYSLEQPIPKEVDAAIKHRWREPYNYSNARLVFTIAQLLGVSPLSIASSFKKFAGIPGRMELVPNPAGLEVYVDFAHTSQALAVALRSLKHYISTSKPKARLIAVFGCAGLRDPYKRPLMGQAGAEYADFAVFTSDDPRTENIWSIFQAMKSGLTTGHNKVLSIPDRLQAMTVALTQLAKPGDVVGIFGKGHEQSLAIGKQEIPWDDRQVVVQILAKKTTKAV